MIHGPGRELATEINAILCSAPDCWREAGAGLGMFDTLDGLLPASRALPECRAAGEVLAHGSGACRILLNAVRQGKGDAMASRNALFLLMYFDSLFVYRELKAFYEAAPETQRRWLDVACRKVLMRCLEVHEDSQDALTREIVRNTMRGRLATTDMVVDLAARLSSHGQRTIMVRDMAVSDGITTLDLAETAARRGVPLTITGTDLQLHLLYANHGQDRVVATSDLTALQYELDGKTYGARHDPLPSTLHPRAEALLPQLNTPGADRITMLAPQVETAVRSERYDIEFREENAFDPGPGIAEADVIRIANLFVERTDDHRGYYYREDILGAISSLGRKAKPSAYLYLNNFRKKIEHIGLWRKDADARAWTRVPVAGDFATDLAGVGDIPIPPG